MVITVLMVIGLNIVTISKKILGGNDVIAFSQSYIVERLSDTFSQYATQFFTPNFVTVFFWGVAGLIVYTLAEGFINGFSGIQELYKVDFRYRHPDGYSHKKFWTMVILKLAFYIGTAMLIVLWTYLFFSYFIPFSSSSLSVTLTTSRISEIIIYGIYSLLGVYTGLMGYLVFWRIFVTYKERF